MRARFWILLAAVSLAAAGGTAGIAAAASYREPEQIREAELVSAGYVLTDCEGNIGVYSGGELILRTDVSLQSLRQVDRELLEAGIEVSSYEELIRLLQDFDE